MQKQKGKLIIKCLGTKIPAQGTRNIDINTVKTNRWLKSAGLKAEKEGFIIAAQDQRLAARKYQAL